MPSSRVRSLSAHAATAAAVLLLSSCGPKDAAPGAASGENGGTVVISTPAEPDNLMPPVTTAVSGKQVEDLVFQRLALIGADLNSVGDVGFTPDLAQSWRWASDSLSVAFALDPAARWHDGQPVRAADVVFSHALYVDPKSSAPAALSLANVDSVTAKDSLTAVVWFKQRTPEQFFDVVFQLYILPKHLLESVDRAKLAAAPFAMNPVGSGPFRFVSWRAKESLELAADTTGGRRRARLDRIVFTMAPDPVTAFTRVATGEADVYEAVRPDKVADVVQNAQLRLVLGPSLDYSFVAFNLVGPNGAPHRLFGDKTVRRALTLATDRRSIVANIYDSLAIQARGPFTVAQSTTDPTLAPLPYAPDSASKLLDAAGWVRGADSVRTKNGVAMRFSLLVPTTSVPRMRAATLMQEQLRRIGAAVQIETADMGGFVDRMTNREFDAIVGAWNQDPGNSSARDSWTSGAAVRGGNNAGGYRSAAFDAQLDSGMRAFSPAETKRYFATAWRIIADDAPAIWLAEPRQALAINRRIVTVGVRADAWWAGLAQWSIPAASRIARDLPTPPSAAR
jgi:peptide/nickel transport system substrate-binding protein